MTRKQVACCNRCGKEIGEVTSAYKEICFFKERVADGAGSMENTYFSGDLCTQCSISAVNYILDTNRSNGRSTERQMLRAEFAKWMEKEKT